MTSTQIIQINFHGYLFESYTDVIHLFIIIVCMYNRPRLSDQIITLIVRLRNNQGPRVNNNKQFFFFSLGSKNVIKYIKKQVEVERI